MNTPERPDRGFTPLKISVAHATICRAFTFEASHYLPALPPLHPCRRMHGHSYVLEVRISGPVDDAGLVRGVEFEMIDLALEPIIKTLDHHVTNDLLETPTVEITAGYLAERISKTLAVPVTIRVYEGPRSWAEVSV